MNLARTLKFRDSVGGACCFVAFKSVCWLSLRLFAFWRRYMLARLLRRLLRLSLFVALIYVLAALYVSALIAAIVAFKFVCLLR